MRIFAFWNNDKPLNLLEVFVNILNPKIVNFYCSNMFVCMLVIIFIIVNYTGKLICQYCNQFYKNPKFLLCHHSYCEECLEKIQTQLKITCPECRIKTAVPRGGVKDLPNNIFILSDVSMVRICNVCISKSFVTCLSFKP